MPFQCASNFNSKDLLKGADTDEAILYITFMTIVRPDGAKRNPQMSNLFLPRDRLAGEIYLQPAL